MASSLKLWTKSSRPPLPEPGAGDEAEALLKQVDRLLAHSLFSGSKRYTNLLRYIVEKTLSQQNEELKERTIGIEVFGKPHDYDTSFDATVRVAAAEVRKRLSLYYSDASHELEPRIEVPVGSYVAEFSFPGKLLVAPVLSPFRPRWRRLTSWRLLVPVLLVVLGFSGWETKRLLTPRPAIEKFWAPVLEGSGPVLLSIDSLPNLPPSTDKTVAKNSRALPDNLASGLISGNNAHPPILMADISSAEDLVSFLRQRKKDLILSLTQGASLSDLESHSVVILGIYSNEWNSRFGSDLHFRFRRDDGLKKQWIEDASHPENTNWSLKLAPTGNAAPNDMQIETDYALISRVLDPSTGHWWVNIAGLTGVGTQSAHLVAITPSTMNEISSTFPKGWERKNLQIVLSVQTSNGSPASHRVEAVYIW